MYDKIMQLILSVFSEDAKTYYCILLIHYRNILSG